MLAPHYLPALGNLVRKLHERLFEVAARDTECEVEIGPSQAELEPVICRCLGHARGARFLREREEAIAWLLQSPQQTIHGDLQDKNLLLGPAGELYICDFEFIRRGPTVFELAVDNIFLKRKLCRRERVRLQNALIAGYGDDAPQFSRKAVRHLKLLRFGRDTFWRSSRSN